MWNLAAELEHLKQQALLRVATPLSLTAAFQANIHGKDVFIFCSNDYLGLRTHSDVLAKARAAIQQWGAGSGSARQVCGDLPPHRELEQRLAVFLNAQACLLFSSGYLANLGAIPALANEEGDVIFSDERNHASLIDGCRLAKAKVIVYRHLDIEDLAHQLKKHPARRRLIVTESIFSMDGDVVALRELLELAQRFAAKIYLDEAHAIGVLGKSGGGLTEELGLAGESIDFRMGTLSKALGSQGAFIAGGQTTIAYLRNFARSYLFDTSLFPAAAAAATAALEVLQHSPHLLWQLKQQIQQTKKILAGWFPAHMHSEFDTPILPLVVGEADRALHLSEQLLAAGVYVQAIRPPTVPVHTSRLRLTVCLGQTQAAYQALQQAIAAVWSKIGPPVS